MAATRAFVTTVAIVFSIQHLTDQSFGRVFRELILFNHFMDAPFLCDSVGVMRTMESRK